MKRCAASFLCAASALLLATRMPSIEVEAAIRSFDFNARLQYAPLLYSLPNHTAIYHEWPPRKLRKTLPNYISAAIIAEPQRDFAAADEGAVGDDANDVPLISPPIHVQAGDILSVALTNSLPTTGLSLHWHGFEMTNALEYDGVTGVTQCPVSPYTRFVYEFAVEEVPGTYWWHTHSGMLGIHAINAIHGPLIVHPDGEEAKHLVHRLNKEAGDENPWYYENERILFFKDGFVHPDALHSESKMGNLLEAVSKDDGGHTVGTSAWEYGTCNGRIREIVPVSAGETYKFRIINGGVHYGLRISIASLKMKVVAADSEPVEPIVVDEVFVHAAERFDVEVTIPQDWTEGQYWIRADTSESAYQGYQNGIRAILNIVPNNTSSAKRRSSLLSNTKEVPDPEANIRSPLGRSDDHKTLNCFERATFDGVPSGGKCLQITTLSQSEHYKDRRMQSFAEEDQAEVHFIDSHFQPYPQHSHFIRFDEGHFYQHVNPIKTMLDPSFGQGDMHPNTAQLHVAAFSTVILVWRTTSLMDHPMHLHGLKMEILDIAIPVKQKDCTLSKCKLNQFYDSSDDIRALAASIPPNEKVLKDTFILPAGGAVVTRIYTREPSLWYSHCHLEMHHLDGMAFILNVGNYSSYSSTRMLPKDYPSCDSPFVQTQIQYPSCDCYENPNTILGTYLNSEYKCSRDHLCHHVNSRAANLEKYHFPGGDGISSSNANYRVPGWAISFVVVAVVCLVLSMADRIMNSAHRLKEEEKEPERAVTVKVRHSIFPPSPKEPVPQTRRDIARECVLKTHSTRSLSDIAADSSVPESTHETNGEGHKDSLPNFDSTNVSIDDSAPQSSIQGRRDSFRRHRSHLNSSLHHSSRSLGSVAFSVISETHSCAGSLNADLIAHTKRKRGPRKDFMLTYSSASGKSWADSDASVSEAVSIGTEGRGRTNYCNESFQSSDINSILVKTKKDEHNTRNDRAYSFASAVSDISWPAELSIEEKSAARRESVDSLTLLSILGMENDGPKNVSETRQPLESPMQQKSSIDAPSESHPTQRVSSDLGQVQQEPIFGAEEKMEKVVDAEVDHSVDSLSLEDPTSHSNTKGKVHTNGCARSSPRIETVYAGRFNVARPTKQSLHQSWGIIDTEPPLDQRPPANNLLEGDGVLLDQTVKTSNVKQTEHTDQDATSDLEDQSQTDLLQLLMESDLDSTSDLMPGSMSQMGTQNGKARGDTFNKYKPKKCKRKTSSMQSMPTSVNSATSETLSIEEKDESTRDSSSSIQAPVINSIAEHVEEDEHKLQKKLTSSIISDISVPLDLLEEGSDGPINVSVSSDPLQASKEPNSLVESRHNTLSKARSTRRVSFNLDLAQQGLNSEEEKTLENTVVGKNDRIVETAAPVANQDISSSNEKQNNSAESTNRSVAEVHRTPSSLVQRAASDSEPFSEQLKHVLLTQYKIYRPLCVNTLRVFEVCSLGILTGFLFYDVGNNKSFLGLSQRLSLFFFSTTLWTFTRMYPSVGFSYQWSLFFQVDFKKQIFDVTPVVLGRLIVVLSLEAFWPLVYVFVCYPFASVFGSLRVVILVGLFLLLNNLCYISLGSVLGVYCKRVPLGMIASTIFSQTSLVAAGFYTQLPPALDWIRYISPFYWSYRGILKSALKWNDTVECFKGTSEVGANQCYLEYHVAIDQYKERGLNVAMYNDPSSTVYLEFICLISLLIFMNSLIFLKAWLVSRSFGRPSNRAAPVTERRLRRRITTESISSLIVSRFDSTRSLGASLLDSSWRKSNENDDRKGTENGTSLCPGAEEEGATENYGNIPAGANLPRREVSRFDSLRPFVMARLESSRPYTWK